jgi:hypothetical protein
MQAGATVRLTMPVILFCAAFAQNSSAEILRAPNSDTQYKNAHDYTDIHIPFTLVETDFSRTKEISREAFDTKKLIMRTVWGSDLCCRVPVLR